MGKFLKSKGVKIIAAGPRKRKRKTSLPVWPRKKGQKRLLVDR